MDIQLNDTLLALLALLAAGFGAFATVLVGYLRSRTKLSTLQKQFDQRLNEIYFKNAREHIDTLYRPLNKATSNLYETFRAFEKKKSNHFKENDINNAKKEFFQAFDLYCSEIDKIYKNSLDVYLVGSIESNMVDLRDFIESSREEYSWSDRCTDFVIVYLYLTRPLFLGKSAKNVFLFEPLSLREAKLFFPSGKFLSINSKVFSLQFDRQVSAIKSDIKSVTLGEIVK